MSFKTTFTDIFAFSDCKDEGEPLDGTQLMSTVHNVSH